MFLANFGKGLRFQMDGGDKDVSRRTGGQKFRDTMLTGILPSTLVIGGSYQLSKTVKSPIGALGLSAMAGVPVGLALRTYAKHTQKNRKKGQRLPSYSWQYRK